jgi:hypothetical protein
MDNETNESNKLMIIDETTTTKKNKFTVVKNIDLADQSPSIGKSLLVENQSQNVSPIRPPTPILLARQSNIDWDFDTNSLENDFRVNNDKTNLESNFNQSSRLDLNSNEYEDDDDFNENLPFIYENTNHNFRENEGQDTITSLSNNIYLKQLAKIRKKASIKSSSSKSSLNKFIDETNPQNLDKIDKITSAFENEPRSASPDKNTSRNNLLSLFTKRESFNSRQSVDSIKLDNLLQNQISFARTESNKSVLDISQLGLSQNIVNLIKNPELFALKDSSININTNTENDAVTNKSEQVFQVLKEVIDNTDDSELTKQFIQQVLDTIKMQQRIREKKKDNEKKACFVLEIFVFFTIFLMSVFLIKNVIIQLKIIDNNSLRTFSNTLNNSVNLNITELKIG